MAGMEGFSHTCEEGKIEKGIFRKSLRESSFKSKDIAMIWDFYVARSFAAATGNPISLEKCGWKDSNNKKDGYPALEQDLALNAGIDSFCIVRAKTVKDTLVAMDLRNEKLYCTHPRAVLMQNYTYESDENEHIKIKSGESRINAIFRHMRNSFAHGNTYFFENDMCLLEDKDGNKITAEILIPCRSLIEWVHIVDRKEMYYSRNNHTKVSV